MQQMHQLITNGRSRSHLNHRLALCIIGLIALVHGKNGWIEEQSISRGRVLITGDTHYYTVVWHFVYNIFICIYLYIASSPLFVGNGHSQGSRFCAVAFASQVLQIITQGFGILFIIYLYLFTYKYLLPLCSSETISLKGATLDCGHTCVVEKVGSL